MKSFEKIIIVLSVAMLMFLFVLAASYAETVVKNDKKDNVVLIDSKSKTVSYKVTWNANIGKIGAKKTLTSSVKKGSKIAKLPTTPNRSGYTFKGWYSKKSGGTKITKNTKPKKSVIYYAQWKKRSTSTNSNIDSKLLGEWTNFASYSPYTRLSTYSFGVDGKFLFVSKISGWVGSSAHGDYKVSGGKITFTNIDYKVGDMKEYYSKTVVAEYKFVKEEEKEYLRISGLNYPDTNYLDDSYWFYWTKSVNELVDVAPPF